MKFEGDFEKTGSQTGSPEEVEDVQLEMALSNFRESVRGWSKQEFGRGAVLPIRHGASFWVVKHPGFSFALASMLAVTAISVPVGVHIRHSEQVLASRRAADDAQKKQLADAERQGAYGMTDDELLSHVDSDIAQGTPDAMEPLASFMSDSTASK